MAHSAAALPLLVAMKSDFHETYNGRLLVDRFATTFTRPTRREAEEEAYRTYMHDTVDAAYTLLKQVPEAGNKVQPEDNDQSEDKSTVEESAAGENDQ